MKKEKHYVNKIYGNHQLARYIDVYEVSANRCHSVPESGYKGTEATLVDDPAWNEKFSSYSITGATLTGNNFILNNDVTAQANYETAKNVTTIKCNSTKNSGFIGDTASLTNSSPAWNEKFSSYSITGSTLTGSNFRFTGSNITAQANFETAKNVTLQTDGHGTIASTKSSGFINDTATLSNTASNGYGFSGYSITGATLTGSNFKFTGSNITAKAWFSAMPQKRGIYGFASTAGYFRGYGRASAALRENYGINSSGVDWTSTNASLDITVSGWSSNTNIPMKAYSAHSGYYDYFNWQNTEVYPTQPDYNYYNFTARGLKKDIHVTQVAAFIKDAKFGVASSQNGPWLTAESTLPGLTQIVTVSGFDWTVNDKIYFSADVTGNYKMSFTGYVLE